MHFFFHAIPKILEKIEGVMARKRKPGLICITIKQAMDRRRMWLQHEHEKQKCDRFTAF